MSGGFLQVPAAMRAIVLTAAALGALAFVPVGVAVPLVNEVSTAASTRPAGSLTIPAPARAVAGDVLVAVIDVQLGSADRILAPSGWSLVRRESTRAGVALSQAVYVRTSALESNEVRFRFSRAARAGGAILVVRRADPARPVEGSSGSLVVGRAPVGPGPLSAFSEDALVLGFYAVTGGSRLDPPAGLVARYRTGKRSTGIVALGVETVGEAPGTVTLRRGAKAAVAQALVVRAGPFVAAFETGDLDEFDAVIASPSRGAEASSLALESDRVYEGRLAARARISSGNRDVDRFARGSFHVDLGAGSEIWYGVAVYLPSGFYAGQRGQVDLLRWDNWTIDRQTTDRGGIVIFGSDHKARLVRGQLGLEQAVLVGPFTISEATWHWLEVHQRLSDVPGEAFSAVLLDGKVVGVSSDANSYGRRVTRLRYGIVACGDCLRAESLELWFDKATFSKTPIGQAPREARASAFSASRARVPSSG